MTGSSGDDSPVPFAAEVLDGLPASLRLLALTHASLADDRVASYERLEFLGDAILGAAVSAMLYRTRGDWEEGRLSQLKAELVSRRVCHLVAGEVGLADVFVQAAGGAAGHADDLATSRNVLAALVESVIGAVFVEHGFAAAAELVEHWFGPHVEREAGAPRDAKSELQEWAQERGETVSYRTLSSEGPDHARTFRAEASVSGIDAAADGEGGSRKAAEQQAAARLLARLRGSDRP